MIGLTLINEFDDQENRELGPYGSLQITYDLLRDAADGLIATRERDGWRTPDGLQWTDIVFVPLP